MSERIINALMELFALAASLNGHRQTHKGRSIVELYIKYHLPQQHIADYLISYAHFLKEFQKKALDHKNEEETRNLIVHINEIALTISQELPREERLTVLLNLLDIILIDETVADIEISLIGTVSEAFSIPDYELELLKKLVHLGEEEMVASQDFIVVSGETEEITDELEGAWIERNKPKQVVEKKRLLIPDLSGRLIFQFLRSYNAFVVKYTGTSPLILNQRELVPGRLFLFDSEGVIHAPEKEALTFSQLITVHPQFDQKGRIALECRDLSYTHRSSGFSIKPFGDILESGSLVGIIGEKEAGKSTLVRLLSGQLRDYKGHISINGYDLALDWYKLRNSIGYVPEKDVILEDITVYDNLYFTARLCYSESSKAELKLKLEAMIDLLELGELKEFVPQKNKLSLFQRKKVNLGLELIKDPAIIFLDEPTTGLSPADAEQFIRLLRNLAITGKLIIASINHPTLKMYRLLHHVWILDEGGYMVYRGAPGAAVPYFQSIDRYAAQTEGICEKCGAADPERIFEILNARKISDDGRYIPARKRTAGEWYKEYCSHFEKQHSPYAVKKILPQSLFIYPDLDKQFFIYSARYLRIMWNTRYRLLSHLIMAPILGILIAFFCRYTTSEGYSFSTNVNIPAFVIMSVLAASLIGLLLSVEEIVRYRDRMKREEIITLSLFSCLNVRVVFLIAIAFIQTGLFTLAGTLILSINGMFWPFWIVYFSMAASGVILGLVLSSAFRSRVVIYALIPLILIIQMLFGGAMFPFDRLPKSLQDGRFVPLEADLVPSRWANEALMVHLFVNNKYSKNVYAIDQALSRNKYAAELLLPLLMDKADSCQLWVDSKDANRNALENNIELISNELQYLDSWSDIYPFEFLDKLEYPAFNANIASELLDYLTFIRFQFYDKANQSLNSQDSIRAVLTKKYGTAGLEKLKKENLNEKVAMLVLNRETTEKIYVFGTRIVPRIDPVYHVPDSKIGRAQWYAPVKLFNGQYINTIWFNVFMIWMISFLLYILLLTDLPAKFFNRFER